MASPSMKRVLIADAQARDLDRLTQALRDAGFDVVGSAGNADEVVSLGHSLGPDIAVLDIALPGEMDSIQACNILQDVMGIPVVFTGLSNAALHRTKALDVAPGGFVIKPFQTEQIATTLKLALARPSHSRQLKHMAQYFGSSHHDSSLLTTVLESSLYGALILDSHGQVLYQNNRFKRLCRPAGAPVAHIKDLELCLQCTIPNGGLPPLEELARSGLDIPSEYILKRDHGPDIEVEVRCSPLAQGARLVTMTDVTSLRTSQRALSQHEKALDLKNRIADVFLTASEVDLYSKVVAILCEAFDSQLGFFGYMDDSGNLVVPTLTGPLWNECDVKDKHFVFPVNEEKGARAKSLRNRDSLLLNKGLRPPEGHLPMDNALLTPILLRQRLIGQIALANKPGGFDEQDRLTMESIAAYVAPILDSKLRQQTEERERHKAELALIRSESQYKQIVQTALEGIWTVNAAGHTTFVNEHMASMLGYTPSEMLGRNQSEFMPSKAHHDLSHLLKQVHQGFSKQYDSQFLHKDGAEVWAMCSSAPLMDSHDNVQGVLTMVSNITYRKVAENALLESEERFRQLVENINEVLWIRDYKTGQALYVSPRYEDVWGRKVQDFHSRPFDFIESVHPEDRERVKQALADFQDNPHPYHNQYRILLDSGETRWVKTSTYPVRGEGEEVYRVVGISENITDRQLTSLERDRLARVIEQLGEIVIITDPRGMIQYVNPAFEKISGRSRSEVEDDNMGLLESPNDDATYLHSLYQDLENKGEWRGRYQYCRPDGKCREVKATLSPIHDGQGQLIHYVSVQRDVTEELTLERQLGQARKMEALGTLAGGIAHDFNNILMAILGFTEMALDLTAEDDTRHTQLRRVQQAGERAKDIVQQILAFSRRSELVKAPLDISPLVKEALKLLAATMPASISIKQNIHPDVGKVLADPGQIHQVVMNLCANARQALEAHGDGLIQVHLDNAHITATKTVQGGDIPPGQYIRLKVQDNGPGIRHDVVDRIFDPFFTTKAPGVGTGMGLSVVHGVVTSLDGYIWVQARPDKGTTFTVLLPTTHQPELQDETQGHTQAQGSERILLVDDEEAISELGKIGLERRGYEVAAFCDPTLALRAFTKAPKSFDCIITDQTMPGFTGLELAQEITRLRPGIPVILCTGFSESDSPQVLAQAGVTELLTKPLRTSALAQALRRVLDQSP